VEVRPFPNSLPKIPPALSPLDSRRRETVGEREGEGKEKKNKRSPSNIREFNPISSRFKQSPPAYSLYFETIPSRRTGEEGDREKKEERGEGKKKRKEMPMLHRQRRVTPNPFI